LSISLDAQACRNFDSAVNLEWVATNGLGGYASGTVVGVNTRKYHGYMVVAAKPPVDRFVALARVEDRVIVSPKGGAQVVADLSTNEFADVIHPQGYKNLVSFELRAGPVWRYEVGGVIIEKSLTTVHGQDICIVRYAIVGSAKGAPKDVPAVRLQVQPMFAGRDFHATIQLNQRPGWSVRQEGDALMLGAPECPVKLVLSHNADKFNLNACWWYNFTFRVERARGYPDREDLWTPGLLEFSLVPGKPVGFVCATKPVEWKQHADLVAEEEARHTALAGSLTSTTSAAGEDANAFLSSLALAADQFIVKRGNGSVSADAAGQKKMSVIAGYPWFEDWGRDTFIALPGLTLVTGRHEMARMILATFADHRRRGLLPNRFPDKAHTPEYHTVDAALWFVQAAYQYWRYSGDSKFLRSYLYPALCEIVECYRDGTDFDIRMDPADGLIRAGVPGVQLTWMDAKVGDWVVTPRVGKPVEINALWYNALRIMTLVSGLAEDAARVAAFSAAAARVEKTFAQTYFCSQTDCLFDVIGNDGKGDPAIRPNQLLAVSLPFSPLGPEAARKVVAAAQRHLLTPLGLRTLAPVCPGYRGRCAGDPVARDMAYHQGTAWPWLTGPFVSAYVKVGGNTPEARKQAWAFLSPMQDHLKKAGLGSISEIADGDPPHTPRGCPAQAWSVGEVLRCYWEDILAKAPAWPHDSPEFRVAAPAAKSAVPAR
jgi:predicted glycogen debranching enzyme